jgi:hypothetical protein
MILPLCPTCGRRGSERNDTYINWKEDRGYYVEECPSAFHDAADYGPMLLEAGKALLTKASNGVYQGPLVAEMNTLDAIVAAAEGRKEDRDV